MQPINTLSNSINVCYFPGRERNYSRSRVLVNSMREAGLNVLDCSSKSKSIFRYFYSFFNFLKNKGKCNIVFVGFMGQPLVPFVKMFTRKKILFDAFVSCYQTLAFDRKIIRPNGVSAFIVRFFEKYSCQLADQVLLDTNQHIQYFIQQYHLPVEKFDRILVSSDTSVMYPREGKKLNDFLVHFHGEFQALHGAEYIIEAAKLIPHIQFQLLGHGYTLKNCQKLTKQYNLKNITFLTPVTYMELPNVISKATVCLGIFGNTQKTNLVIPHKVYEALALKMPLITSDTPAARELLTHEENVLFCKAANPKSLADAIERLYNDESLRIKIASNGYNTFKHYCSEKIMGNQLKAIFLDLIKK